MVNDFIPNYPKERYEEDFQALHHQFVASARVVRAAHAIDPEYEVGSMLPVEHVVIH